MKKEKILSFIVSFCMILTMLIFSGIEAIAVGSLNPSFSQSFTVTNLTEGTHVEVLKTVDCKFGFRWQFQYAGFDME